MGFLVSKRDGANLMLALADGGAVEVFDAGPAPDTSALVHLQTPNTEVVFAASFVPGAAPGILLAAFDFTPKVTGRMRFNFQTESDVSTETDQVTMAVLIVPNLTAVTGGTLIAPGITSLPASMTPSPLVSGLPMWGTAANAFIVAGQDTSILPPMAGVPLLLSAGTRYGIAVFIADTGGATFTDCVVSASLDEIL